MNWKLFTDQMPEPGRTIVYGNHRSATVCRYQPDSFKPEKDVLAYKSVTHWDYLALPPALPEKT